MTKFRMAALAALALTAGTLLSPALASAAPASTSGDLIAPVQFTVSPGRGFGFTVIDFKCHDYNGGKYPYLVFDSPAGIFQPITYFTGDGTPIGHYFGDFKPNGTLAADGTWRGVTATLSRRHETVTFYCARTKAAAKQGNLPD
ncbi:hypothetical protein G9444_6424 [Rhodococcus erythropolis]|uniref:Uncharacterized protein n=1 Tax=Rhodococcus erythropolis TaxID=1833 RepID=A0A6G9D358_RHOER|nr:hypothetical protein [Rhodococcus erythropolis]QIP43667.1 hypothetical protein G9444_6424 [Rhodococcus erythropolis]